MYMKVEIFLILKTWGFNMKIYTGTPGGSKSKMEQIKKYDLGLMLSTEVQKGYSDCSCALDNGAYESHRRGLPWSEDRFLRMIEKCWNNGISLDFIVLPDIVGRGMDSYLHSIEWIFKLQPAKLALAVQNGIEPKDIELHILDDISYIFVGGTDTWKWQTAKQWVDFAHTNGKKCHIGKCGTLEKLQTAKRMGVDSVDSTSFVRNESWDIIERFRNNEQVDMFVG